MEKRIHLKFVHWLYRWENSQVQSNYGSVATFTSHTQKYEAPKRAHWKGKRMQSGFQFPHSENTRNIYLLLYARIVLGDCYRHWSCTFVVSITQSIMEKTLLALDSIVFHTNGSILVEWNKNKNRQEYIALPYLCVRLWFAILMLATDHWTYPTGSSTKKSYQ